MAMNSLHLPQGLDSSLGTISIHISSTNTRVLAPEKVNHEVVSFLKRLNLEVGTLSVETRTEATRSGVLKTMKVMLIVTDPTEDE